MYNTCTMPMTAISLSSFVNKMFVCVSVCVCVSPCCVCLHVCIYILCYNCTNIYYTQGSGQSSSLPTQFLPCIAGLLDTYSQLISLCITHRSLLSPSLVLDNTLINKVSFLVCSNSLYRYLLKLK